MKVAVIIPCLNEQLTVRTVVADCQRHLPNARVFVLDNGSTDQTADFARRAGAQVIHSPLRGKGHVLRHALRLIEADYYLMIDGDGTYPMDQAERLLNLAQNLNFEMVVGSRLELGRAQAFRPLHFLGNRGFTSLVRLLFGYPVQDLLSGFRVFSRRFVDEVRFVSSGFEIETELTIRAVAQNLAFCEVQIPYAERPVGSRSKLRTFRDGWLILRTIIRLWRDFRPLTFFSLLGVSLLSFGILSDRLALAAEMQTWSTILSAMSFGLGLYFSTTLDHSRFRIAGSRVPRLRKEPPNKMKKTA